MISSKIPVQSARKQDDLNAPKGAQETRVAYTVTHFSLHIDCVDGESFFSMGSRSNTPSTTQALEFLNKHDHEGSTISLDLFDYADGLPPAVDGQPTAHPVDTLYGEDAYNFLKLAAGVPRG